ncbi:unnamed protein product [Tenebrio molitor]|nr:unnamed protein product [Tenebrio molitor]
MKSTKLRLTAYKKREGIEKSFRIDAFHTEACLRGSTGN